MDNLAALPATICLSKVTLAAGTTTTLSNTGTTTYAIRGKAYTKTAMTNVATPTTDHTTGAAFAPLSANQGCVFVASFDAAGNLRVSQGNVVALDTAGKFIVAPQFPIVPDTDCPVGYIVIQAGSTAVGTWTFGTNNLSGVTGLTYTFVDLINLPDRPQVA